MDRGNNRSIYICYNNNSSSSSSKVRRWNNSYGNYVDDDGDGLKKMMMMSWPPRCYTCSFCKREFRSAQALGGHMNVHRRDRAHLKQLSSVISSTPTTTFTHLLPTDTYTSTSSSTINLNFPPNPNHMLLSPPSPSPPPPPPTFQSPTCTSSDDLITNLVRTTTPSDNYQLNKLSELGFKRNDHYSDDHSFNKSTDDGFLRLGLEMNIHPQDLDLELRLGYS